jgi:ParB family chromosome partitioning protein
MAGKQSDYLTSLLSGEAIGDRKGGPDAGSPPALSDTAKPERPVARAGMSLLGRESALARVASGEVRQVTQLLLDPARVRVWTGNARVQAQLSEANCRDLIDSIVAEGGQKVPAVVRRVEGDSTHDYELIAGTRRHFAVSWLRANNYPDQKLLAQVADLDDEAAFRLADIENRARKDISDIERARNYAAALNSHYGGRAVRMAERLKLSKGWLSKMLKAATIPEAILGAFADWRELTLNPAYKLALTLEDAARLQTITAEAKAIAAENARSAAQDVPALPGPQVLHRLLTATTQPPLPQGRHLRMEVNGPHGRAILAVKGVNRHGITLHVPLASGADDEQIAQAVREVLNTLRMNGVSVR